MKEEDLKEFEKWWTEQGCSESDPLFETAKTAWAAAIAYEQNKPIRTYRWDGVIR
jgi:hypothetical protein